MHDWVSWYENQGFHEERMPDSGFVKWLINSGLFSSITWAVKPLGSPMIRK